VTLQRYARLERWTPLRRTPMKRRRARRIERRAETSPYIAYVCSLDCARCGRRGPSEPAHLTDGPGQKGTAFKAPDVQTAPLCKDCHDWIDGRAGRPPAKDERRRISGELIRKTQRKAIAAGVLVVDVGGVA
jgi:hypothetical protein